MARIRNPPISRIFANLLRLHQNGFHIFGQAWSLPGVDLVQFLPHQIADQNYLRMMRLVRNRLEAEEEGDGVAIGIAKVCEIRKITPRKYRSR